METNQRILAEESTAKRLFLFRHPKTGKWCWGGESVFTTAETLLFEALVDSESELLAFKREHQASVKEVIRLGFSTGHADNEMELVKELCTQLNNFNSLFEPKKNLRLELDLGCVKGD